MKRSRGRPRTADRVSCLIEGIVNTPLDAGSVVEFDISDISTLNKIFKKLHTRNIGAKEIFFICEKESICIKSWDHFDRFIVSIKYDAKLLPRYFCTNHFNFKVMLDDLQCLTSQTNEYQLIRFAFMPDTIGKDSYKLTIKRYLDIDSNPIELAIRNIEIVDNDYKLGGQVQDLYKHTVGSEIEPEDTFELVVRLPLNVLKSFMNDPSHTITNKHNAICTYTYEDGILVLRDTSNLKQYITDHDKETEIYCSVTDYAIGCTLWIVPILTYINLASMLSKSVTIMYTNGQPSIFFKSAQDVNKACMITYQMLTKID